MASSLGSWTVIAGTTMPGRPDRKRDEIEVGHEKLLEGLRCPARDRDGTARTPELLGEFSVGANRQPPETAAKPPACRIRTNSGIPRPPSTVTKAFARTAFQRAIRTSGLDPEDRNDV